MACYNPRAAWIDEEEGRVRWGGRGLHKEEELALPCGKCIGCRNSQAAQWTTRCIHEASLHERNCFVTLTYIDSELPPKRELSKRDWQLFAKRLREGYRPFRFFACGEYGPKTQRPHYHAVLFGIDFHEDRVLVDPDKGYYISPTLQKAWKKGRAIIARLTEGSAAYTAQYTGKKQRDADQAEVRLHVDTETGEITTLQPEFLLMSRNPGIGARWYERYKRDIYPSDNVVNNGFKHRPPKYYDEKLRVQDPELYERIKATRRAHAETHAHDTTPRRLRDREHIALAKRDSKTRDQT